MNLDEVTLKELFEELLDRALDVAGAGVIEDKFRQLHYAEEKWPVLLPKSDEKDPTFREKHRIHRREELMELLGDEDGTQLKSWLQLYCDDLPAFRERARQFTRAKNTAHENGMWIDGTESD